MPQLRERLNVAGDGTTYDKDLAEKAWSRLLVLFDKALA